MAEGTDPLSGPRICGLATVFLRNTVGASAAFILVGSLSSSGFAETPIERGFYLVNGIGACGNCHARDTAFNRTSDLAGGAEENGEFGHVVMSNITPDPRFPLGWPSGETKVECKTSTWSARETLDDRSSPPRPHPDPGLRPARRRSHQAVASNTPTRAGLLIQIDG
jgi:hypothetical protein